MTYTLKNYWKNTTLENLQKLMTEIFKVKTGIAPEMMKDVIEVNIPHNLRKKYVQYHVLKDMALK